MPIGLEKVTTNHNQDEFRWQPQWTSTHHMRRAKITSPPGLCDPSPPPGRPRPYKRTSCPNCSDVRFLSYEETAGVGKPNICDSFMPVLHQGGTSTYIEYQHCVVTLQTFSVVTATKRTGERRAALSIGLNDPQSGPRANVLGPVRLI